MIAQNIEDVYPLSPMQNGMLFHSLLEPDDELYIEQVDASLTGPLDQTAFERAWQQVIDRHPVLRTAILSENIKEPVQVVHHQVALPMRCLDWVQSDREQQEHQIQQLLCDERRRGFKLNEPPLMRLALVRQSDTETRFILTYHHLLMDGWSMPLLFSELFAAYEAKCQGFPLEPPSARPYRDYIVWLKNQDLAAAEAFWRRTLETAGEPAPLQIGFPDLDEAATRPYGYQSSHLTAATTAALQTLARSQHVTLNAVVQAAWALLLSHYTRQEDVLFGMTVSGRPADLPGSESMLGLFINTLPVALKVNPELNVSAWLAEVNLRLAEMRQFEYTPLYNIQRWSGIPGGRPLFDSLVVFENYPLGGVSGEAKTSVKVSVHPSQPRTNYPLTLAFIPGEVMEIETSYDRSIIDDGAVARLIGHLQTLLAGMAAAPERACSALGYLTDAERTQLLVDWNPTEAPLPPEGCVHQRFEAQAQHTPDAPAAIFAGEALTYSQLDRNANCLAHALRRRGVGPDTIVGVCLSRSIDIAVAVLGILKAGGAFLPLDPILPLERLQFMVADAGVSVLITQSGLADRFPSAPVHPICLDLEWPAIDREPASPPDLEVTPENLAYVIYTSGSTGKPKGVLLAHRGLSNLVNCHIQALDLGPGERVLQFAMFSFDACVAEIFTALGSGAALVFAEQDTLASAPDLEQLLIDQGITVVTLPPTMLRTLAPERLPGLRAVISAGEDCPLDVARRWSKGRRLFNGYGPTEATVGPALYPAPDPLPKGMTRFPIGRPLPNTQMYILDPRQQPVPVGVPGEIFIGGVGVAQGYLNRPDLTARSFIPNPFTAPRQPAPGDPGPGRLYRTGDLGRYLPDGNIEFLGRIDFQVKIHGFRVELGEIEAVLMEHAGVQHAVVVADDSLPADVRLFAYIVPSEGSPPSVNALRDFAKQKLPEYMLPAAYVFLEALPLLPNGKIDRRALPKPGASRPRLDNVFVAPQTAEEKQLAEIWSRVLKIQKIGTQDDFFALGGDSILSMQVSAEAGKAGLKITPKQVFLHPTIAELALSAGADELFQADQGRVMGSIPLTPIQHQFFEENAAWANHWNTSMLIQPVAPLEPERIERCLKALVEQHDILRARFHNTGTAWEQEIPAGETAIAFECIDLSSLPDRKLRKAIEAQAFRLQASLDLEHGPLFRVAYFDLGPGRSPRLFFVFHHLVMDAVSWRIFLDDFQTLYGLLGQSKPPRLPAKTTSFQQWATVLGRYARSQPARDEAGTWLAAIQPHFTQIPLDRPGQPNTYGSTRFFDFSLNPKDSQLILKQAPASLDMPVNDLLLTALVRTLARWTGDDRLLIGLFGHGREPIVDEIDLSRTVGWFIATYPVLIDLHGRTGLRDQMDAVRQQLRAVPGHGIGFGLLRYLSGDETVQAALSRIPAPQVVFNYLGHFDTVDQPDWFPFQIAPESPGPEQCPAGTSNTLFNINAIVSSDRLDFRWAYSANLHDRATVERLAKQTVHELHEMAVLCRAEKNRA